MLLGLALEGEGGGGAIFIERGRGAFHHGPEHITPWVIFGPDPLEIKAVPTELTFPEKPHLVGVFRMTAYPAIKGILDFAQIDIGLPVFKDPSGRVENAAVW